MKPSEARQYVYQVKSKYPPLDPAKPVYLCVYCRGKGGEAYGTGADVEAAMRDLLPKIAELNVNKVVDVRKLSEDLYIEFTDEERKIVDELCQETSTK